MGVSEHKPIKIKLNNSMASGMYILIKNDEIKYTKENETKPPNRAYKIQIAIEAMYNNKRCRGKQSFQIKKGTSIAKAVSSLLGKREDMKDTLKAKGTLTTKKKLIQKINTNDRKFKSIYASWIARKQIEVKESTVRMYNGSYNVWIKKLDNKIIDEITEDDIQNIINEMINKDKEPSTIVILRAVLKPLLAMYDVNLNWKRIIFPRIEPKEKFSGDDEKARLIARTLLEYKHPIAKGVFTFLLSGRRINETIQMEHSHINYKSTEQYPYGYFTLLKENTKTNTKVTYALNPTLLNAIKIQKTTKGKIFALKAISIYYHWKLAMESIGVTNMVMHELRSMVAVVALRNGADIYAVSKMLSHKLLSTTQLNYLGNSTEQAIEAQKTFTTVIDKSDSVIDVEIIDNKYEYDILRKLYPHASIDKIKQIIEMMKK